MASPTISRLFANCIWEFKGFVGFLSQKNCLVIHLKLVDIDEISDAYGRIKIWGEQTKADLSSRERGSLADTLRHDKELKKLIKDILKRLRNILREGKC